MVVSTRPLWGQISLDALRHNMSEVSRLAGPGVHIMPAIKANAYGHGVINVARVLADSDPLALVTGNIDEAIEVRRSGIRTPIVMLSHCPPTELVDVAEAGFIPTIVDLAGAEALSTPNGQPRDIYIKVDCGLRRLGVSLDALAAFVKQVVVMPGISVVGIYTHVPFHDNSGAQWSRARIKAFDDVLKNLAAEGVVIPVTQSKSSANLLARHQDMSNAVCVGHLLYGLPCTDADVGNASMFRPVLRSIKSRIIHINCQTGISNGPSPYMSRNSTLTGVVPVGLNDGLRNPKESCTMEMLVRGCRVPVLGVSLEHCVLDLNGVVSEVGDEVTIVGVDGEEIIGLSDLAMWHGCSEREVMMLFSGRVSMSEEST